MMHRVLIIDDNHSFIDSLKVMMKDFSFHYDHSFRFQDALAKIQDGPVLRRHLLQTLLDFDENLRRWESTGDGKNKKNESESDNTAEPPEIPAVQGNLRNENGYSLIIVEQDTETSMKGLDFIRNIVKMQTGWHEADFLLLTSRPEQIEAQAKSMGVSVVEKPVKSSTLRQVVANKLKNLDQILNRADAIQANTGNAAETIANIMHARKEARDRAAETGREPESKSKSAKKKLLSKFNKKKADEAPAPEKKPVTAKKKAVKAVKSRTKSAKKSAAKPAKKGAKTKTK